MNFRRVITCRIWFNSRTLLVNLLVKALLIFESLFLPLVNSNFRPARTHFQTAQRKAQLPERQKVVAGNYDLIIHWIMVIKILIMVHGTWLKWLNMSHGYVWICGDEQESLWIICYCSLKWFKKYQQKGPVFSRKFREQLVKLIHCH